MLLDLETDAGIVGRSYLFAIGKHNLAPLAKLVEAMAEMVKGRVAPFDLERKLRGRYALLGVHNIVLFAMAGIDMAAWDAFAQSLELPLARVLGAAPRRSSPTTRRASASCRKRSSPRKRASSWPRVSAP